MSGERFVFHGDCRWFVGEKPCRHKRLCEGCPHYAPMGRRVLIIKLAAMGDVLRTTTLLPSLARAHDPLHVTWITDAASLPLLSCAPGIDRRLAFGFDAVHQLLAERFDLALCLDKEPRATALVERVAAEEKRGFGHSPWGTPRPLNPAADYAFRLGLDDRLKFFDNTLTYQEIVHRAVELPGPEEAYAFQAPDEAVAFGRGLLAELGLEPARTVGLNTGAGPLFAHKAWLPERFAALADWLRDEQGLTPLLLGGPAERELNRAIAGMCRGPVAVSGGGHDLVQFAGLVGLLRLVVTSDSLAMHLALAQSVPAVILFGSTCAQEILLPTPGRRLSAGLTCQPCYRRRCDKPEHCMAALSLDEVREAVRRVLAESA